MIPLLDYLDASNLQRSSNLSLGIACEQLKGLSDATSLDALELHGGLDASAVVVGLEDLAEWVDLGPDLAALLEVAVDGDRVPQLDGQLGEDVGGSPHGALGAGGEAVEGQRVPAVEGDDLAGDGVLEEKLSEGGGVAGGVFEELDADVGEAGELCGGELDTGGAGDIVVHDGDLGDFVDLLEELAELLQVGAVVEWRDDHGGGSASLGGVLGQVEDLGCGEVANAGNNWDAALGGGEDNLDELLALVVGQSCELSGAAAGDETVDTGLDKGLDVGSEGLDINSPGVILERGVQGHHNAREILRSHCGWFVHESN